MRGCLNENVSKRALFPPTNLITLIFFVNSNVKIPYNIRIYVKKKIVNSIKLIWIFSGVSRVLKIFLIMCIKLNRTCIFFICA